MNWFVLKQSAQAGLNEAKSADEAISKAKDVLSWWLDKKASGTFPTA
jgi:hypothetical protein